MSSTDWEDLNTAVHGLFTSGLSTTNFVARGLAAVQRLVPGEFATYSRASTGPEASFEIVFSTTDLLPLAPLQAFMQIKDRYPLWHPDFNGTPGLRSDYYSARAFRQLDLYTEAYRPFGLDNHLCLPVLRDSGAAMHFSVQRHGGADFTERDRTITALLQPHLASAYTLACERPGEPAPGPECFAHLGLTPRETEVFHWLVAGKRNTEIATILHLRVQTVKDHVANLFAKLHVENRHSAIRLGFEATRRSRGHELRAAAQRYRTFHLRRAAR